MHPRHDLTPFPRLRSRLTNSRVPHVQITQSPNRVKKLTPVKSFTQYFNEAAANCIIRIRIPQQGKICHSKARQGKAQQGAATTTRTNIFINNSYPHSHPLPDYIVTIELLSREGEHWVLHSDPRLNMTPQAEADSPPTGAPGSPDLFSRPRPRPPRSPSQAAKIRVQNRRRQYLENNPDYLSSADNQLAGKPKVIPAPEGLSPLPFPILWISLLVLVDVPHRMPALRIMEFTRWIRILRGAV